MNAPRHLLKSANQGFTLLETLMVLVLMIIIVGMGSFTFGGFDDTPEAQQPLDALAKMVKTATRESVTQGRPIVIGFDKKGFGYYGEGEIEDGTFKYPKGMKASVQRWNGGKKFSSAEGLNWTFYPSGISQAVRFQFESPRGIGEISFNPLTGNPVDRSLIVR